MPFLIQQNNLDKWKILKLDDNTYISTNFRSKETAIRSAIRYYKFRRGKDVKLQIITRNKKTLVIAEDT